MTDSHDRMREKQRQRIEELASYGIVAEPGGYLGCVRVNAGNAEKLLRLLRRLKRLETPRKVKRVKG